VGGLRGQHVRQRLWLRCGIGVSNPLLATHRLQQTAPARLARTLSAWSVSTSAATALLTALWGLLAELIGLRAAVATAGILALPTPLAAAPSETQKQRC
jgi:hypothetical protein